MGGYSTFAFHEWDGIYEVETQERDEFCRKPTFSGGIWSLNKSELIKYIQNNFNISLKSTKSMEFSSAVRQILGDLCTAPRIMSLSPLSLATDVTGATLGASGLWLGISVVTSISITILSWYRQHRPKIVPQTGDRISTASYSKMSKHRTLNLVITIIGCIWAYSIQILYHIKHRFHTEL